MRIVGKIGGAEQFGRELDNMVKEIEDAQPTLEAVTNKALYPIMRERFDTEGRGGWRELTPGYAEAKKRQYGNKPILQRTGALYNSLTDKGAPHNVHIGVGRDSLIVGSDLPYARHAHDDRPIYEFEEDDLDRMAEAAIDDLVRRLGFE
jgi:hypothetical protein